MDADESEETSAPAAMQRRGAILHSRSSTPILTRTSTNSEEVGRVMRAYSIGSSASDCSRASIKRVDSEVFKQRLEYLQQFVHKYNPRRRCCSRFRHASEDASTHWIESSSANAVFGSVILVNAIFLGVESDLKPDNYDSGDIDLKSWLPWFISESIFLAIFTVELGLRFHASGCGALRDYWNVFDFFLVSIGIMDTWILQFILVDLDASNLSFLTLLRVVRLVRLARVLRILRLFRFLRELNVLAQGILGALQALGWSLFLILIVLYMCAVAATTIFGETEETEKDARIDSWFGDLGSSLLTLFQFMTLEDWPEVARTVMKKWPWAWLFFIPVIGLTNFVLLNVITGVVVERVLTCADSQVVSEASREAQNRMNAMVQLRNIFKEIDTCNNGGLCEAELLVAVEDPQIIEKFYGLGYAKYEVENLCAYLEAGPNDRIPLNELVEGCMRIHGQAQSKHLLRVQYGVLRNGKELRKQVMGINHQVKWVVKKLENMDLQKASKEQCREKERKKEKESRLEEENSIAVEKGTSDSTPQTTGIFISAGSSVSKSDERAVVQEAPLTKPRSAQALALEQMLLELANEQSMTKKMVYAYSQELQDLKSAVKDVHNEHRAKTGLSEPGSCCDSFSRASPSEDAVEDGGVEAETTDARLVE